jgi:hypothetical protein
MLNSLRARSPSAHGGYAIMRLKKLKRGNIALCASHANRSRETPNADPSFENIRFIGRNQLQDSKTLISMLGL